MTYPVSSLVDQRKRRRQYAPVADFGDASLNYNLKDETNRCGRKSPRTAFLPLGRAPGASDWPGWRFDQKWHVPTRGQSRRYDPRIDQYMQGRIHLKGAEPQPGIGTGQVNGQRYPATVVNARTRSDRSVSTAAAISENRG